MIDDATTVPIAWLFILGGGMLAALLMAFTWWLRKEWDRNWNEHVNMKNSAALAHKEIDQRIDKHHIKIDRHLDRIHDRIDWIITHGGLPQYPEKNDGT